MLHHLPNILFLCGCTCFAVGTVINMVRG